MGDSINLDDDFVLGADDDCATMKAQQQQHSMLPWDWVCQILQEKCQRLLTSKRQIASLGCIGSVS